MLIDFSNVLMALTGDAVQRNENEGPLKLSTVCCEALLFPYEDERTLSGEEKVERYILSTKIFGQGMLEVSVEDVVLLRKLIGKAFPPLVVGQAYAMLDPKPEL